MSSPANNDESDEKKRSRVAVIGAGITGLAAAHRLLELAEQNSHPLELTVFEASNRVGGIINTQHVGDYLVEMGPDSFITNKPGALQLCQRLDLEDQLIPTDETYRRSLVLRRGKPVVVPEGFMLLAPAKIWPVLKSPIFSPLGKLRMGLEYFIPRRRDDTDESLASFVRRRFGREALDRIVQPMIGGIYTSDPEKLSLKATMPRFLKMEADYRSLIKATRREAAQAEKKSSGARYGLFLTLAKGLSQLTDALASRIRKAARILLDCQITAITRDRDGYLIAIDGQPSQRFEKVLVALPAFRAAKLLPEINRELCDVLNEIEYASSAVVVTGHKLSDFRHPLDAFGLVIPAIERRQVLAVSFPSRKFAGRAPEGRIQMRTFVGGAMQPELFQKSDDELIDITKSEIASIFGTSVEPEITVVSRHSRAMPQFHVGHLDRVARITELVDQIPGLEFAGNSLHGVGIPDCIQSGDTAAEQLLGPATSIQESSEA